MDDLKGKVIEELIDHLRMMQSEGMKKSYDESMQPEMIEEVDIKTGDEPYNEEVNEKIDQSAPEMDVTSEKPLSPEGEMAGEMSDEELEELLKSLG